MPNIFSIIFQRRANYSPLLSLRKTSLSLQPITTLHFLSHNVATPWKNKQKLSEMRPKTSHVLEKNSNVFGKISHVFQETSDVFFALARRDEKEAALLVFHTKETRKQSSESTNLKTISPRAHAYAHNSNFRVFAFTTFTEILATLYVSIHSAHFSDIF